MQAWLRVFHQRANLQLVRLLPLTLVGRSPECHLKIASAQVSRRHCQISLRPDGVYVEDLGSANGTYLDGARLPPQTPTYVRNGSRLELGPAKFLVEYESQAAHLGLGRPSPPLEAIVDPTIDMDRHASVPPADWEFEEVGSPHEGDPDAEPTIPIVVSDSVRPNARQQLPAAPPVKKSLFGFFRRGSAVPSPGPAAHTKPDEGSPDGIREDENRAPAD